MRKGENKWNIPIKRSDIPKKIGGALSHVSETDIFNTKGKVKFVL